MDYLSQMKNWLMLTENMLLVEADLTTSFNKIKKQVGEDEAKMVLLQKVFDFLLQRRNMFQENRHSEWILQKATSLKLDPENSDNEQILYKMMSISQNAAFIPPGTNIFQYKTVEQIEGLYEEINRRQEEAKLNKELKDIKKTKSLTPIISSDGVEVYEVFDAKLASELARNGINEKTHWNSSAGAASSQAGGLSSGKTAITRWCTSSEGTAQSYLNSGPLYVFINEKTGVPLAQFNFETYQFKDIRDYPIIDESFIRRLREAKVKIINNLFESVEQAIRALYDPNGKEDKSFTFLESELKELDELSNDFSKNIKPQIEEVYKKIYKPMMTLFGLKLISKTENGFIRRFVHTFLKQERDPKLEQDFFNSATQGYSKDIHNFMLFYLMRFFVEEGQWPEFEKYSKRILESDIKKTVQEKYQNFKDFCEFEHQE